MLVPDRVTAAMANARKVEFERKISRWNANLDVLLIFVSYAQLPV